MLLGAASQNDSASASRRSPAEPAPDANRNAYSRWRPIERTNPSSPAFAAATAQRWSLALLLFHLPG